MNSFYYGVYEERSLLGMHHVVIVWLFGNCRGNPSIRNGTQPRKIVRLLVTAEHSHSGHGRSVALLFAAGATDLYSMDLGTNSNLLRKNLHGPEFARTKGPRC